MALDEAGVRARLSMLGFATVEEDADSVNYAIDAATERIYNYCHIDALPSGLTNAAVDIACGIYLEALYDTGRLTGITLTAPVTRIEEGDSAVQFANSTTADSKFTALLAYLAHGADLLRYRRLLW